MAAGTTPILGVHDGKLTGAVPFGGAARVGSARVATVYIKASIRVSAGLGKLGESDARLFWFSFPASVVLLMSQANCRCNRLSCKLYGSKCSFSKITSCHEMSKAKHLWSTTLVLRAEMQYGPCQDRDVLQLTKQKLRTTCPRG